MVLGLLRVGEGWQCKGRRAIEWRVCVRLREGGWGGRMWRPVLVPPPLLSSQPSPLSPQPVSGSLPPPPADFSLGGSEKNCPLSLSPTAAAWALPCPPDINQHTHTPSSARTHSPQRAPLTDRLLGSRLFSWPSLANETSNPLEKQARDRILEKFYWEETLFSLYGLVWVTVGDAKCAAGWFCTSLACFEINSKKWNYTFDKYCQLWIVRSEQGIWPVMAFFVQSKCKQKGPRYHKKIQEWNLLSPSNWLTGFFVVINVINVHWRKTGLYF